MSLQKHCIQVLAYMLTTIPTFCQKEQYCTLTVNVHVCFGFSLRAHVVIFVFYMNLDAC